MRLIITFARTYPWQSIILLVSLLLAGIAEGASVSALLPLLSFAINREAGGAFASGDSPSEDGHGFERFVTGFLTSIGVTPTMGVLLVIIVSGITIRSGLLLMVRKRIGYTSSQVMTDLRLDLLRALLSSRWEYFIHQPVGRLANAMATEALRASQSYVFATTLVALLIQASVYTVVALLISWRATVASLGAGMVILAVSYVLVRMSRRAGKRQTNLIKSLLVRLADTLQSVKPLKAMARENLADAVLTKETTRLNRALKREVLSKAALEAAQEPMFATVIATAVFVALEHWQMPLATIMVMVLVLARILGHLGKVQKQYQKMVTTESAFWSLKETIQQAEAARETSHGGARVAFESGIRFDQVSFAYEDLSVLRGASLEIPAGSLTTLVGSSGAGKTTIIDLVTGLLEPTAGEVFVDDVPLRAMDIGDWRRQLGYVPQENLLLHDSVYHNVTLGDPGLDETDAEHALRAAGAWDFVAVLPDGMHTLAGERGSRLSGGQRQRIMIARALVHQPKLLILDEATSALDPASEDAIRQTLEGLRGSLTILAISHQPALVDAADRVYLLEDGKATLGAHSRAAGLLPRRLSD